MEIDESLLEPVAQRLLRREPEPKREPERRGRAADAGLVARQHELFGTGLDCEGSIEGGPRTERELIDICRALVPVETSLSLAERALVNAPANPVSVALVARLRQEISAGADPLGDAFCRIRSSDRRREQGAVYTPATIVDSMMSWLMRQGAAARVVDPGAGSGRFICAAARVFPEARLVAIEMDPLAALLLRANLRVQGLAERAEVHVIDYREAQLGACPGRTAFVGNPPYVRHHAIGAEWKRWYVEQFSALGVKASALAGLHLHFFLRTRLLAKAGDFGAFITSAEWLDVNYGSALRRLLLSEFGGVSLHVLEPSLDAFPGTATTAAISCFRVGESRQDLLVRSVATLEDLGALDCGVAIPLERLDKEPRWSEAMRPIPVRGGDEIELGSLFRVHRGQVTGANAVWIAGEHAAELPPRFKLACVTRAIDLIRAGQILQSDSGLKRLIDLPPDLDQFDAGERRAIERFLAWARNAGADRGYIARHRKAWWSVGLRQPAPILCTYMARRAPQFSANLCGARHINIAHGLYPLQPIAPEVINRLVRWLNRNVDMASGRTYAGGLTKFEPREIERLRVPGLERLVE